MENVIQRRKEHTLQELDDKLFSQIEILEMIDPADADFENTRLRAEAITCIADRIIRNRELELRNQVWNATKQFKLQTRYLGMKNDNI